MDARTHVVCRGIPRRVEVNSALAEDAGNPDTVLFPEQPPVVTSEKWSWTVNNELIDFRVALEHSLSMSGG